MVTSEKSFSNISVIRLNMCTLNCIGVSKNENLPKYVTQYTYLHMYIK